MATMPAMPEVAAAALARLAQPRPPGLLPLYLDGATIGWLAPDFARFVLEHGAPLFERSAGALVLDPALPVPARTAAWNRLAVRARDDGWCPAWRDEHYDVRDMAGDIIATLERGAFRRFGLNSAAIHVNGVLPDGRQWIARRSPHKAVDPGLLDNLVAGGVGAGERVHDTLLRECLEEAGIPPALARTARPVRRLRSQRPEFDGWHDEWLEVFDLALPAGFVPHNADGEVAGFQCLDRAALQTALAQQAFTVDAGAAVADWLLRTAPGA